jgi:hypothetical protein
MDTNTPTVSKAREKGKAAISSESDSDSYYSDWFDSAKARATTPPNAHIGAVNYLILRRKRPLSHDSSSGSASLPTASRIIKKAVSKS